MVLPLTLTELPSVPAADDLLRFGGLSLVRSLESFSRFLEVAALANGQVTNVASLARDSAVARPTVQGYFEILVDTLIGAWLPAWRPRAKVKETSHPKFYLFDCGVVRALSRRLREPLDSAERGHLLETLIFHELRAWIAYSGGGGELSYYRTPAGVEVDFVWSRGKHRIGIEVKAARQWRLEYGRALAELRAAGVLTACHGIHPGHHGRDDSDQPRRAFSIAATSIFRIVIIASNTRFATAGSPLAIASVSTSGVICHDTPHLSLHQPQALSCPPWPTIAFQ